MRMRQAMEGGSGGEGGGGRDMQPPASPHALLEWNDLTDGSMPSFSFLPSATATATLRRTYVHARTAAPHRTALSSLHRSPCPTSLCKPSSCCEPAWRGRGARVGLPSCLDKYQQYPQNGMLARRCGSRTHRSRGWVGSHQPKQASKQAGSRRPGLPCAIPVYHTSGSLHGVAMCPSGNMGSRMPRHATPQCDRQQQQQTNTRSPPAACAKKAAMHSRSVLMHACMRISRSRRGWSLVGIRAAVSPV